MTISTYAAAVGQEMPFCISVSALLALGFLLVSFYSLVQIFYLWSEGSKISHRKRAFIRLIACNLIRCVWYGMSSYHLLPENFDHQYIDVPSEYLKLLFLDRIGYSTWEIIAHLAYLWPTALLFTSYNWMLINWLKLYQKEKLRLKLALGNSSSLSPQQRKSKAELKQKKLLRFHQICNVVVYASVILLAPLHLHSYDVVEDLPEFRDTLLSQMSPEAILSSVCAVGLLLMTLYCCRILGNLHRARTSDSEKLKRHTILILMVGSSQLCYYAFVIISQFYGVFDTPSDHSHIITPGLVRTHALLRVFEILHNTLIVTILAFPSLSIRAPFPAKSREITQEWLTQVLRENGTIKSTTTVIAFSFCSIYGGCHFKVARVSLTYSVEKPDDPHKTVIVKLLYWDKPIYQRVMLYIKYLMNSLDREAMYLTSYRVESLFYKHQMNQVMSGFRIPQIYYNSEDVFNNRFGMVLQDLSKHDDGQPNGFTVTDARRILESLAEFHASHFGKELSERVSKNFWKLAGYWTGVKRESVKANVEPCWNRMVANFPEFDFEIEHPCMGGLLKDKLKWLDSEYTGMCVPRYSTLCHGDFKISNLFIKGKTANHPNGQVFVIDFQWLGIGNVAIDVVYFLYTSLRKEDLDLIPDLLDHYYNCLVRFRPDIRHDYSKKEYLHHCNVALVDYCVYCISSKWAMMTLTEFRQYETKVKDGLHLRSPDHMKRILKDSYRLIYQWSKRPSQLIDRKAIKQNSEK